LAPRQNPNVTKQRALAAVREICLGLPETSERLSHGAPTFFIREKRSFATVWDNHHGDGRFALICAAPDGLQAALVEGDPERFYVPPYVGHRGWIGVRLDRDLTATRSRACSRTRSPRSRRRISCPTTEPEGFGRKI
jgi:hypothetical protein